MCSFVSLQNPIMTFDVFLHSCCIVALEVDNKNHPLNQTISLSSLYSKGKYSIFSLIRHRLIRLFAKFVTFLSVPA